MREHLSSALLMALMHATPEQMKAIEGILGCESKPEPVAEDVARRAFQLVEQLDSEQVVKAPTVLTVFRLYCVEEMTADKIARHCGCAKGTVINRLKIIREKTGMEPDELRRFSDHFTKIEEDASDARAEYIHRKGLIDENSEEDY